jgi:hypothetical protein
MRKVAGNDIRNLLSRLQELITSAIISLNSENYSEGGVLGGGRVTKKNFCYKRYRKLKVSLPIRNLSGFCHDRIIGSRDKWK